MTNLEDLQLFNTKLTGKIPKSMSNLKKLRYLRLVNTELVQPEGARGMLHKTADACAKFLSLL